MAAPQLLTIAEFLSWEKQRDTRYEFVNGVPMAMAGGTPSHAWVASNLLVCVGSRATKVGCRAFGSDLKVWAEEASAIFYPDLSIACEPTFEKDCLVNPRVIIEVLSPSTSAYDRGQKFDYYRAIPSLQEYVLVWVDVHRVDVFSKHETDHWVLKQYRPGQGVTLNSIPLSFSVDEIYEGLDAIVTESTETT